MGASASFSMKSSERIPRSSTCFACKNPLFKRGQMIGWDVDEGSAHSFRLHVVDYPGCGCKFIPPVTDLQLDRRTSEERSACRDETSALTQVSDFTPNLDAGIRFRNPDFGMKRKSSLTLPFGFIWFHR
jgi:hypothetical protein